MTPRKHLVVVYDVTGLPEDEVSSLSGEAEAQAEHSSDYTEGEEGHRDVPVVSVTEVDALDPVIVVTRHPDFADEITLHGVQADVVYLDLGSSFDTTPNDEEQGREWAESVWGEVKTLPAGHPARAEVLQVIADTVQYVVTREQLAALLGVELETLPLAN